MGYAFNAADIPSAATDTKSTFNHAGAQTDPAAALWSEYHAMRAASTTNGLSILLGEYADEQSTHGAERCVEILLRLGDLYESKKDYISAAACYHSAIPYHDKTDPYAWQRCSSMQDKAEAQAGAPYAKDTWDAIILQTWESLFVRFAPETQATPPSESKPEPMHHRPAAVAPQEAQAINAPVFIAA